MSFHQGIDCSLPKTRDGHETHRPNHIVHTHWFHHALGSFGFACQHLPVLAGAILLRQDDPRRTLHEGANGFLPGDGVVLALVEDVAILVFTYAPLSGSCRSQFDRRLPLPSYFPGKFVCQLSILIPSASLLALVPSRLSACFISNMIVP